MKTNGRKYREYVLVYVDNVLSKSDKPESTMAVISSNITHLWISRDTQKISHHYQVAGTQITMSQDSRNTIVSCSRQSNFFGPTIT